MIMVAALSWLAIAIADAGAADAGQASNPSIATPAAKNWSVPRTPDGHPDFQGVWDFRTATPLERPGEFEEREFLTDQNVTAVERRANERLQVYNPDDLLMNTPPWWLDYGTHVVSTRRSSLVVDPSDGRIPPMTRDGLTRQNDRLASRTAAEDPEGLNPWDRCITRGLPNAMLPAAYNNNLEIVQTPGYVVIVTEMIHEARIVPIDGRGHPPQQLRAWMGDSRGRWEGDTLIVETTNFFEKSDFRGAGANLRLIERFTRIAEGAIDYRLTVEDPTMWTASWTVTFPLVKNDSPMYEYACHEGNYSLQNILRAARAEETAAAARRR